MGRRWQFQLVDALDRVFPELDPRPLTAQLSAFRNELVSFQLAVRAPSGADRDDDALIVEVSATGVVPALYSVDLVGADLVAPPEHDDDYERTAPGLFPDILVPAEDGVIRPFMQGWRAVWIDLDVSDVPAGATRLVVTIRHRASGEQVGRAERTVQVRDEILPPLSIANTQWLHADAIADAYRVPVFSEKHWSAIGAFMASAARMRATSLMVPVWTPPVDTAVGARRRAVQLIEIDVETNDRYAFRFDRLDRWLSLMRTLGFTGIEIPHLFTQWGARSAPAVYGSIGGRQTQLFGWDTAADSPEYRVFLEQLIPALRRHLDQMWAGRDVVYHVSDEPADDQVASFGVALGQIRDLLDGVEVRDAVSDLRYVTEGLIPKPIVPTDRMATFLAAEVPELWAYHCLTQSRGVANRFLGLRPARQRILGAQLFAAGVRGMLHWGFNYYYSAKAQRFVDPFRDASADGTMPGGDPFIVYPAPGLQVWESTRHRVAAQAMDDHRLLQLAADRHGRSAALDIADPSRTRSFSCPDVDTADIRALRDQLEALTADRTLAR